MSRLIDTDAFYKRYCEVYEDGVDEEEIDRIAYMLSTEPTAYDVEKVIEEVKDDFYDINFAYNDSCRKDWLESIIRKGGAE